MAYLCYLVETTKNFRLVKNAEFHLQPLSKRCLPACKRCSDVCCALDTHACTNWFDKVHTLTIVNSLVGFCNLQRKVNGWLGWLGFWFGLTSFDAIARAWAWSKRCWCRYCCTMLDKQCMCCVRDFKIIRFSTLILPIAFRCSDSQKTGKSSMWLRASTQNTFIRWCTAFHFIYCGGCTSNANLSSYLYIEPE